MAKRTRAAKTKPPIEINYGWRTNVLTFKNHDKADPNLIGRSLAEIATMHGGVNKPKHIVAAARVRGHALHPFFEWNVEQAAMQHWLETARILSRAVGIIDPDRPDETPRRAWISVEDDNGIGYHTVDEVSGDVDLQAAVMRRAARDLKAWQDRYRSLGEICELVEVARRELDARLAARESRQSV